MRFFTMALALAGLTLGAQSFALEENNDDTAVYLFNEGDQPADAEEAKVFPTDSPDSARTWIQCESRGYRMTKCRLGERGQIRSVRLVQRTSFAPCVAGRTFGATNRYIWVSRGCGGNFLVRFNRRNGGGGGWDDDDRN